MQGKLKEIVVDIPDSFKLVAVRASRENLVEVCRNVRDGLEYTAAQRNTDRVPAFIFSLLPTPGYFPLFPFFLLLRILCPTSTQPGLYTANLSLLTSPWCSFFPSATPP